MKSLNPGGNSSGVQPTHLLQIALMPDGQILVNGPLVQKLLCFGMLESAKDAIRAYKPGPQVLQAKGVIP